MMVFYLRFDLMKLNRIKSNSSQLIYIEKTCESVCIRVFVLTSPPYSCILPPLPPMFSVLSFVQE
jgi:hypothetical protein